MTKKHKMRVLVDNMKKQNADRIPIFMVILNLKMTFTRIILEVSSKKKETIKVIGKQGSKGMKSISKGKVRNKEIDLKTSEKVSKVITHRDNTRKDSHKKGKTNILGRDMGNLHTMKTLTGINLKIRESPSRKRKKSIDRLNLTKTQNFMIKTRNITKTSSSIKVMVCLLKIHLLQAVKNTLMTHSFGQPMKHLKRKPMNL